MLGTLAWLVCLAILPMDLDPEEIQTTLQKLAVKSNEILDLEFVVRKRLSTSTIEASGF